MSNNFFCEGTRLEFQDAYTEMAQSDGRPDDQSYIIKPRDRRKATPPATSEYISSDCLLPSLGGEFEDQPDPYMKYTVDTRFVPDQYKDVVDRLQSSRHLEDELISLAEGVPPGKHSAISALRHCTAGPFQTPLHPDGLSEEQSLERQSVNTWNIPHVNTNNAAVAKHQCQIEKKVRFAHGHDIIGADKQGDLEDAASEDENAEEASKSDRVWRAIKSGLTDIWGIPLGTYLHSAFVTLRNCTYGPYHTPIHFKGLTEEQSLKWQSVKTWSLSHINTNNAAVVKHQRPIEKRVRFAHGYDVIGADKQGNLEGAALEDENAEKVSKSDREWRVIKVGDREWQVIKVGDREWRVIKVGLTAVGAITFGTFLYKKFS